MGGAARRGSEAVRCRAEECLFAVRVEVAVCALGEGAEIVSENDHDTLDFLPVYSARAIVHEWAPHVARLVSAEIVDTGTCVCVDGAGIWGCWLDRAAIENMKLGAELALGLGYGGRRPRRSGVSEKRGAA